MDIQAALPSGWIYESDRTYGVIITAVEDGRHQGYVTVDEHKRGFVLGISQVHKRGEYAGRNWRAALYADAVGALQMAITR